MGQNAEPGPLEWGVFAGLAAGLLSGCGSMIHFATTSDLGVIATMFVGGFCGIAVAYAVGWLVYIGLSMRDGLKKGLDEVRKVQAATAEKQAAEAKQQAQQRSRNLRQQREYLYGRNAAFVVSALDSVKRVVASEAARTGWLGDVDFGPDTKVIADNLQKAHALRKVADRLSGLDNPGADDRRILEEANTTIAELETIALKRVELIAQCATEAELIDESLRKERADARTAQQRAALHAKLSGMLYGIEATPTATSMESGVDGVMARVQAYREVKNAIKQARGESSV
jgi:hypothetical protein